MCSCTPGIKTPFCGKPGCTWPKQREEVRTGYARTEPARPMDPTDIAMLHELARKHAPDSVLSRALTCAALELERLTEKLGTGCFASALPGEPTFTVRGQDVWSPITVRMWCEMAAVGGCTPDKIKDARLIAMAMEQWPQRKLPD